MTRLPIQGEDDGTWGGILNDFLSVEHNGDGTLKASGSLSAKADDSTVIHKSGTETVSGAKNFTGGITVNGTNVVVTSDTRLTDQRIPTDSSVTAAKLSVTGGNNSQVLTKDSSQGGGLKWSSPASATVFNVKDYGATGNGSTDDTAAIQSAIDAASTAGGGTVWFPAGTYMVTPTSSPALAVTTDGIKLVGDARKKAILKKSANGILLSMNGPSTDLTGATHLHYCSIESLTLHGNNKTGLVLRLYYANNLVFRDMYILGNIDTAIDTAEFWDSRFENMVIESCGGGIGTSTPNILLRNSAASSGFGYSPDSVNQIHFISCRWEGYTIGSVWIQAGVNNTNAPNGIYITNCKMETSSIQGGPLFSVSASCIGINVNSLYMYAGNFGAGFSTPQNVIQWAASKSSLENVEIANSSTTTINSGVDLFSAEVATLRNVIGKYTTAPTGSHIYFEASSTGDFILENTYSGNGSQFGGTVPTKFLGSSPIRQVAGPVSDASFTRGMLNGTLAIDTTNSKLYVRSGGGWTSTKLAAWQTQDTLNTLLATGQESIPRWAATSTTTISMGSGVVRFAYFTARQTQTITQLRFSTSNTAAGATPTLVKFGLYSVDVSGNLTQIGVTASDTTIFAGAQTDYTKTMTASASVTEGSQYALAAIVVTAAAAPTIAGVLASTPGSTALSPRLCASITGQSDLAASYTAGSLSGTQSIPYAVALP